MSLREVFSIRLKHLRTSAGLSQRDIAEKIGVSATAYNAYENGKSAPSFEMIEKLAEVLDCGVHELLSQTLQDNSVFMNNTLAKDGGIVAVHSKNTAVPSGDSNYGDGYYRGRFEQLEIHATQLAKNLNTCMERNKWLEDKVDFLTSKIQ